MSVITEHTQGATGTQARKLDPIDIPLDLLGHMTGRSPALMLEARAGNMAAAASGDSNADRGLAALGALYEEAIRRTGRPPTASPAPPGEPPYWPLVLHSSLHGRGSALRALMGLARCACVAVGVRQQPCSEMLHAREGRGRTALGV